MSGRTTSPNLLPPPPTSGRGVRRLNRWPIYIGAGILCVIVLVVAYTYQQRMARQQQATADAAAHETQGAASHAKDAVATAVETQPTPAPPSPPAPPATTATASSPPPQKDDMSEQARKVAWQSYYQQLAAAEHAKQEAAAKAFTSDTSIEAGGGQGAVSGEQGIAGVPGIAGGAPAAGVDGNGQAEKRAFLAQAGDPLGLHEDLMAVKHDAKANTVMEGTAIPGVMIGGMTSDMPGMVIGLISQNVYDSATGENLLIPQGSRVVGIYDNSVSNGQERIGVIWNRIIFPDTSSLQLGSMEGADQGGYAGFHDQVNTHFWSKFGAALMISIAGAGVQLAQPNAPVNGFYSPTQIGTSQVTQQMSQLGEEYARAGLAIPNTLEIRPGYAFNIMVLKDIHLPPYVDHRNAGTVANLGPVLQ
jgi:type IV secretion system protein TrbI